MRKTNEMTDLLGTDSGAQKEKAHYFVNYFCLELSCVLAFHKKEKISHYNRETACYIEIPRKSAFD